MIETRSLFFPRDHSPISLPLPPSSHPLTFHTLTNNSIKQSLLQKKSLSFLKNFEISNSKIKKHFIIREKLLILNSTNQIVIFSNSLKEEKIINLKIEEEILDFCANINKLTNDLQILLLSPIKLLVIDGEGEEISTHKNDNSYSLINMNNKVITIFSAYNNNKKEIEIFDTRKENPIFNLPITNINKYKWCPESATKIIVLSNNKIHSIDLRNKEKENLISDQKNIKDFDLLEIKNKTFIAALSTDNELCLYEDYKLSDTIDLSKDSGIEYDTIQKVNSGLFLRDSKGESSSYLLPTSEITINYINSNSINSNGIRKSERLSNLINLIEENIKSNFKNLTEAPDSKKLPDEDLSFFENLHPTSTTTAKTGNNLKMNKFEEKVLILALKKEKEKICSLLEKNFTKENKRDFMNLILCLNASDLSTSFFEEYFQLLGLEEKLNRIIFYYLAKDFGRLEKEVLINEGNWRYYFNISEKKLGVCLNIIERVREFDLDSSLLLVVYFFLSSRDSRDSRDGSSLEVEGVTRDIIKCLELGRSEKVFLLEFVKSLSISTHKDYKQNKSNNSNSNININSNKGEEKREIKRNSKEEVNKSINKGGGEWEVEGMGNIDSKKVRAFENKLKGAEEGMGEEVKEMFLKFREGFNRRDGEECDRVKREMVKNYWKENKGWLVHLVGLNTIVKKYSK